MIIVSACLAGINCKFDGGNNRNEIISDLVARGLAIPVCPEQLGGEPTPREPVELNGLPEMISCVEKVMPEQYRGKIKAAAL